MEPLSRQYLKSLNMKKKMQKRKLKKGARKRPSIFIRKRPIHLTNIRELMRVANIYLILETT